MSDVLPEKVIQAELQAAAGVQLDGVLALVGQPFRADASAQVCMCRAWVDLEAARGRRLLSSEDVIGPELRVALRLLVHVVYGVVERSLDDGLALGLRRIPGEMRLREVAVVLLPVVPNPRASAALRSFGGHKLLVCTLVRHVELESIEPLAAVRRVGRPRLTVLGATSLRSSRHVRRVLLRLYAFLPGEFVQWEQVLVVVAAILNLEGLLQVR